MLSPSALVVIAPEKGRVKGSPLIGRFWKGLGRQGEMPSFNIIMEQQWKLIALLPARSLPVRSLLYVYREDLLWDPKVVCWWTTTNVEKIGSVGLNAVAVATHHRSSRWSTVLWEIFFSRLHP